MPKIYDFANFAPIPDAATVRCWINDGATKAIIGASFPRESDGVYIGVDQINACASAGMDTECYAWLKFTDDWESVFRQGAIAPVTWTDCEDPSALGAEGTRQRIRDAITITGAADIYCRRLWWQEFTADWDIVAEYSGARLWEATLNGASVPFIPFGGFSQRHMEQYAADISVCGITVDISQEEDAAMTDADWAKLGEIVKANVAAQLRVTDLPLTDQQKQDVGEIVKLHLVQAGLPQP